MLVESGVDGGTPDDRLVVGEGFLNVFDAFGCGDHTGHMDLLGRALGEEGLVTQLHAASRGKHRIGDDEVFALDARRGQVLHMDAHVGVLGIGVLAIS